MTKLLTDFWIKYAGGSLRRFSDFRAELGKLRTAFDPAVPALAPAYSEPDVSGFPQHDLGALKAPSHFRSDRYLRNFDRADWRGVDPWLACWAGRFQLKLRKLDIPVFVFSAARGEAEQTLYFQRGTSRARFPNSAHNRGAAVDLIHSIRGWELTRHEWSFLHHVGRAVEASLNASIPAAQRRSLDWGGDWAKLYDPAHWQLSTWRQMPPLAFDSSPLRYTPTAASRLL